MLLVIVSSTPTMIEKFILPYRHLDPHPTIEIEIIIRELWTTSSSTISYQQLLLDTGIGSLQISSGQYKAEVRGQVTIIS